MSFELSHRRAMTYLALRLHLVAYGKPLLLQLLELSAQVELWTSRTQERLLPLAPHVWRTRAQVAVAARALWGGDIFVELYGNWALGRRG